MADRYWVGGTGSWSSTNTANWSTSSNGAGGASVPTAADNVFFDANSNTGTGAFTVTMANTPRVCNDFTASGLDGAMTLAGLSIGLTVSGSLSFPATNFTRTYTGTTTFNATTTGKTITTNGVTFGGAVLFDGVGGAWTLQDALLVSSTATTTTTLTNGTLDLNNQTLSTARFSSSNSNTRAIAFGTGNIACTGTGPVFSTGTSTGLTTTGTQVVNVTNTGSTAISIGPGTLSEENSISFNITGGTYTLGVSGSSSTVRNLDFTDYAGTLSEVLIISVYGDLTLSTGMSLTSSTFTWNFRATSGTKQITTNGKTLDFPVTFNGIGGTFRLEDALTIGSTRITNLTNGTLNLNGKTLTVGSRFQTATGTKNLTFNGGTLVCPDANTLSFNNAQPTGFTTTTGAGTGTISMTAATAKTFVGGGSTYNCTLNQGGAGALTVTGSNTFNNITNTVQPASVLFTAGTTNTFTSGFSLSGTAGNLVTIGSVTSASHTLSKSSGTVSLSYCSISRSNATGGATWQALKLNGNVDGNNNTGWIFLTGNYYDASAALSSSSSLISLALRYAIGTASLASQSSASCYAVRYGVCAATVYGVSSISALPVRYGIGKAQVTCDSAITVSTYATLNFTSTFLTESVFTSSVKYTANQQITFSFASNIVALARKKWENEVDTAETWTPISDNSEIWTQVTDNSEIWTTTH